MGWQQGERRGCQSGSKLVQKVPQKIVLQMRRKEGGGRREAGKTINPGCSPGLPLLLHVGRGGKLIMWLRLIR